MRQAASAVELWHGSGPAYVAGRQFLRWVVDAKLAGIVIWGSPTGRDAAELAALLDAEVIDVRPEADVIVDFRWAKSIDAACFFTMRDHIARHSVFYATHQEREVLLRPAGFVGTIVQIVDRTIDETFRLGYQNLNWQRDEDDVTNGNLQGFYAQKRPPEYGGLSFA